MIRNITNINSRMQVHTYTRWMPIKHGPNVASQSLQSGREKNSLLTRKLWRQCMAKKTYKSVKWKNHDCTWIVFVSVLLLYYVFMSGKEKKCKLYGFFLYLGPSRRGAFLRFVQVSCSCSRSEFRFQIAFFNLCWFLDITQCTRLLRNTLCLPRPRGPFMITHVG